MAYLLILSSFLACLVLTPLVRVLAIKRGWMAHPGEERWHKKPTALMGGIAIYIGVSIGYLTQADFATLLPHLLREADSFQLPSLAAVIWLGVSFLFVLGLLDDFFQIKPHSKLVGQILIASLVVFLGFRLHWFTSLTIDTIVTTFWIVGITNAFNLLDNMDGLCAGIGLIAAFYLAYLFGSQSPEAALLALVLAAVLGAFLCFNFSPASIFMGDSGSLVIGFTLAMLSLNFAGNGAQSRLAAYAVPILVLMVAIFDTTLVTFIRILSGRKASTGGKDHMSHRLVLMGFSERDSVFFLYAIGAIAGLSAIFVSQTDTLTSPVVIVPVILAVLLMGFYLSQIRVYPEKEFSLLRDRVYTPILIELTHKKQLLIVVLDFCLMAFAYYLAYRLRFGGDTFLFYFRVFLESLPAIIVCKFVAFFAIGVYRGIWRYMSTNDVFIYLKATFLGTVLSVGAVTFIYRFEYFSKGVFLIDFLLLSVFILATRGSFRFFTDVTQRKTLSGDRVLIYGAGRGGEILLREILNNPKLKIRPVGFIDDDMLITGKKLMGYPVLGVPTELKTILQSQPIDGILISFHDKSSAGYEQVRMMCHARRLFLKQFSVQLQDVDLEA